MKKQIFDSLVKLKKQYKKLKVKLSESFEDIQEYQKILKEINKLKPTVKMFENYLSTEKNIEDSLKIIKNEKDKEILSFAKEELSASEKEKKKIEEKLQILLLPKDENDEKNVIVEIRGAAGGDEANIFAGDLFEIYKKWSSLNDCSIQIINYSKGESGGFSQIVFKVIGQNVFSKLKYESGVHRVQRVPKTEVRGRVHTSTVTVTVMPEADKEVEIKINPSDLKIDTFRSTGPGGQSVNTTDSAVRITHLPTKICATSQQGKSQIANKEIAMQTLKTRLYNLELEKQKKEIGKYRKLAGSGSRSEKIRTYNYPQDRVTDHRLNLSVSLKSVLSGKLNEIFEGLRVQEQNDLLNYSKDKGSE